MKIEGTGSKINVLRFKHKGQDLNFQHINTKDIMAKKYTNEFGIPKTEIGTIEFEDIKEIDNLIKTLEYFKDFCELHIGEWK